MAEWKVPGYTELKVLGSGGFGQVVLARHDASGTLVAVKYLRRDLLADAEFWQMFRGEAEVLASLDDPNIVRLHEYVESASGAAIVMELVDGVSLRGILTHQGKTTAEAALVVLQGSLLGLAAAHRRGVVHRDYKPENVLVDGHGASKLTDFGIAARTGDRPIPAGTLAYAPPEQLTGAPASPASDVYAATATFYECLVGRPPFRGDVPEALLYQHLSQPVPLDPVPGPLRPLVAAGMAKDPASRPTDATTFVTALQATAARAYGRHWHDRGRSHLGEAALLLALLWPTGAPPAVQASAVQRIPLRRRINLRHLGAAKAASAAAAAIAVVAAGTALAATGTFTPSAASRSITAPPAHPIAVQSSSLPPPSPPSPSVTSVSPPPSSPSQSPSPSPSPSLSSSSPPPPPSSSPPPPPSSSPPPPPSSSPPPPPSSSPPPPPSSSPPPPSPSPSPSPSGPHASVCEPDGTGCTLAGTYPGPDALINSDFGGFQLTWTESVVQQYSSGEPLYWTAYVTYTNTGSSTLSLSCQGNVADLSSVQESMSGGDGDDGNVAASSTTCTDDPSWTEDVSPGDSVQVYATFHNVPWPGSAVALQWGDAGTSPSVYPFN
jgi:eukaryotic-like serine/threonine-protein kinase